MDRLAATAANRGSVTHQQPSDSTSTHKHIKAAVTSVLMFLSMVGGLL